MIKNIIKELRKGKKTKEKETVLKIDILRKMDKRMEKGFNDKEVSNKNILILYKFLET